MTEGFVSFNSIEEGVEFMRKQEEEANKHVHPKQRAVTWGDCWIRFLVQYDIIIFGKALDADYYQQMIDKAVDEEDKAEWEFERKQVTDAWERGYVYGWAWSIIEPAGEPGSTHMVNLWPIPEALFEKAKAVGWIAHDLDDDTKEEINGIYQEYREHVLSEAGRL